LRTHRDTLSTHIYTVTTHRDTVRTHRDTVRTHRVTVRTHRDTVRTHSDTVRAHSDTVEKEETIEDTEGQEWYIAIMSRQVKMWCYHRKAFRAENKYQGTELSDFKFETAG